MAEPELARERKGRSAGPLQIDRPEPGWLLPGNRLALPATDKYRSIHARRSKYLPELPTVAESGLPGYEFDSWIGVLGPAGLPKATVEQRNHVEKFIHTLMNAGDLLPELLVEPEGLDASKLETRASSTAASEIEDPLLELFRHKSSLPAEQFLNELRKQRTTHHPDTAEETILPV